MLIAARKYGWPALAAVVSAWLLYVAVGSISFQICTANKENKQTEQPAKENPSEVLRSLVVSARVKTDCMFVFLYDSRDAITAIATAFISIFTFTLWQSTGRLWVSGEKQRILSEDTAKRQLRAYVHIEDVKIEEANSLYGPLIHVIIKNYGSTPARRITNTCVRDAIFIQDERKFSLDNVTAYEVADLAPSQTVHSMFPYSTQKWINERQRISSKSISFYVFGRIDYIDAFDKKRWTEFRYRLPVGLDGIEDTSFIMKSHAGNRTT